MASTLRSMAKTAVKKPRTQYQCTDCGYTCAKWLGRCPECGSWGTLEEKRVAATSKNGGGGAAIAAFTGALPTGLTPTAPALPIVRIDPASSTTTSTGIGELDRVLGSGLVPGSVVLLAGEPGVGKSTLLLEVAAKWATQPAEGEASTRDTRTALYVTAEESVGQVRMRAQLKPSLLIVDSVQTMHAPGVEGVAGGVAQSRAVTAALTALAKNTGIPILLVGHVTKDGNVAGPRVLEHLVDVVLNFEGDRHSSLRMLRGIKNRFGATDEVGCFEQVSDGIKEVEDPSGLFLSHRDDSPDGTAVTVAMDGVRPILAEVQSLLVTTPSKNPRRAVTGLDATRVPMVLAVLAARAGRSSADKEVYIATVGGMRVHEPAADLAIALATASAMAHKALPTKMVVLGEVGLAGEIRRIPNTVRRLQEAQRLGFTTAIIPNGEKVTVPGIAVHYVRDITDAISTAFNA